MRGRCCRSGAGECEGGQRDVCQEVSSQVAQTAHTRRGVVAGHTAVGLRGLHVVGVRHFAEINFHFVRGTEGRNRAVVVDVSPSVFAGEKGSVVGVREG